MAVDVLFVEMKFGERCGTSAFTRGICSILDEKGLTYIGADGIPSTEKAREVLDEYRPRLVLSCPRFNSVAIFEHVLKRKKIRWGYRLISNWNMMTYHHELPLVLRWTNFVRSARNVFFLPNNEDGLHTLKALVPAHAKQVLPFPNVLADEYLPPRLKPEKEHVRIAVVGRACYSKNMPCSALAAAAMARERRLHVYVWSPPETDPLKTDHVQTFGILKQHVSFMPWTSDFREQVHDLDIDLALCPSTTESFGYSMTDFLGLGIPVVGSRAVRFLPPQWQVVDESDPVAIALKARKILDTDRHETADMARIIYQTVQERNRTIACNSLELLLS